VEWRQQPWLRTPCRFRASVLWRRKIER
jgi:hypothetical protein